MGCGTRRADRPGDVGHECRARWRTGSVETWRSVQIVVGQLDDGRWYVERIGQVTGRPRAYKSKAVAWRVVRNLMAVEVDARWERVLCYPSAPLLRGDEPG